ncbi:hypothetical protein B0H13DRAFT_1703624, partial [Mycena leptocephala]
VSALENVPEAEKDWHPGLDGQVLDLVHSSLYCIVYGRQRWPHPRLLPYQPRIPANLLSVIVPAFNEGTQVEDVSLKVVDWSISSKFPGCHPTFPSPRTAQSSSFLPTSIISTRETRSAVPHHRGFSRQVHPSARPCFG